MRHAKAFLISLVVGVAILGVGLFSFGFTSGNDIDLALSVSPSLLGDQVHSPSLADAANRHFGIKLDDPATGKVTVTGKLLPRQGSTTGFVLSGNVVARLNGRNYVLKPVGQQMVEKMTLKSGKTVIYGSVNGTIQTKGEDKVAHLMFAFDPTTHQATASLTAGYMGDHAILYFGQSFLTKVDIQEMINAH